MGVKCAKKGPILIAKLSGEIDHHSCEQMRKEIERQLEEGKVRSILFCMQEVTFMDSAGIGLLIGRFKYTQALGGKSAIACANEKITKILHLSAVDRLIPFFSTAEEALAYIGGNRYGRV